MVNYSVYVFNTQLDRDLKIPKEGFLSFLYDRGYVVIDYYESVIGIKAFFRGNSFGIYFKEDENFVVKNLIYLWTPKFSFDYITLKYQDIKNNHCSIHLTRDTIIKLGEFYSFKSNVPSGFIPWGLMIEFRSIDSEKSERFKKFFDSINKQAESNNELKIYFDCYYSEVNSVLYVSVYISEKEVYL